MNSPNMGKMATAGEGLSVLISVYRKTNAEYLHKALLSVWDEQSYQPSEIVLVQDGPVGASIIKKLEEWQERLGKQFKWVKQEKNLGLAKSLNHGLSYCSYELVARMDDDDISLPHRFDLQYRYMMNHKNIGVLGAQVEERDSDLQTKISQRIVPVNHLQIVKFSKSRSPINHPSVMFRKSIIYKFGGYPEVYPEDYALWGKLICNGVIFHNLPQKLVVMRTEDALIYRRGFKFFFGESKVLFYLYRLGLLNFFELSIQLVARFIVRSAPMLLKKKLYELSRR